jgi:ATP-dependent RNA helicase DDX18/HAS1
MVLFQLENYFLHQSAKDGYRSYLQAYASYSHKKIFDVNQLDLVKVGKAFGFSVPPRVNLNIAGSSTKDATTKANNKRKRGSVPDPQSVEDEEMEGEWLDVEDGRHGTGGDGEEMEEDNSARKVARRQGKDRRVETLGRRKVEKEVYKKGRSMKKTDGVSWSR